MARIRTIKPELPQSESIGRLSRDARLLFIQLFTVVDDCGRARAASRLLASLLYPYDGDAPGLIGDWMMELEAHRMIRRYEVDGSQYLEIIKWLEHQKIDRPSPSRLPEYREGSSPPREGSRGLDADLGPSTLDLVPHTVARDCFEEFWKEYPRRDGDNPKLPAKLKFESLVKTGVDPDTIIAGARQYAAKAREKQQVGTQYIAHALKWLSEKRWADATEIAIASARPEPTRSNWDGAVKAWLRSGESSWPRWGGNQPGFAMCRCPPEILIANGIDPDTGRKVSKLVKIVAGTDEMSALVESRQRSGLRPPRMFEVETDGLVQTICFAETRWPKDYNDFGERIAPATAEDAA